MKRAKDCVVGVIAAGWLLACQGLEAEDPGTDVDVEPVARVHTVTIPLTGLSYTLIPGDATHPPTLLMDADPIRGLARVFRWSNIAAAFEVVAKNLPPVLGWPSRLDLEIGTDRADAPLVTLATDPPRADQPDGALNVGLSGGGVRASGRVLPPGPTAEGSLELELGRNGSLAAFSSLPPPTGDAAPSVAFSLGEGQLRGVATPPADTGGAWSLQVFDVGGQQLFASSHFGPQVSDDLDDDIPMNAQPLPLDWLIQSPADVVDLATAQPMADSAFVGLAIGVVFRGHTYLFYRGVAERGCDPDSEACSDGDLATREIHDDTLFGLGSVTKTFTGTLLALLAKRGRVHVDSTCSLGACDLPDENSLLQPLLPEPYRSQLSGVTTGITLSMLGDHTAGVPRNEALTDTPDQVFAELVDCKLSGASNHCNAPGNYVYSNFGYAVLGHVLAIAALPAPVASLGRWEDINTDLITDALDMDDTRVWERLYSRKSRVAQGYTSDGNGHSVPAAGRSATLPGHNPSGGLYSTPADMLKWLQLNMSDPSASCSAGAAECELRRTLSLVRFRRVGVDPGSGTTGLGWGVDRLPAVTGPHLFSKNGACKGFRAYIGYVPDSHIGVFVLANYTAASVSNKPEQIGTNILSWLSYVP